jgi:hypothetical protein
MTFSGANTICCVFLDFLTGPATNAQRDIQIGRGIESIWIVLCPVCNILEITSTDDTAYQYTDSTLFPRYSLAKGDTDLVADILELAVDISRCQALNLRTHQVSVVPSDEEHSLSSTLFHLLSLTERRRKRRKRTIVSLMRIPSSFTFFNAFCSFVSTSVPHFSSFCNKARYAYTLRVRQTLCQTYPPPSLVLRNSWVRRMGPPGVAGLFAQRGHVPFGLKEGRARCTPQMG